MGSPAAWGLLSTLLLFGFALWCVGLYQWHFAHLPNPLDPNATWQWAIREARLFGSMATFTDLGARLRYLALSPSDAQFDLLFLTCDLLLFGFAAMRLVTPAPIFAYRLLVSCVLAMVASSFTLLPVPPHATGFALLAYTRWALYVDVLTTARTVIGIEAWRRGGRVFGTVALALIPLMAIATSAIGSAMSASAVAAVCLGALGSQLFHDFGKVERRYVFTEAAAFPEHDAPPARLPPSIPAGEAPHASGDDDDAASSASGGTGLP